MDNLNAWDERDIEYDLRSKMAALVAQIVSGIPGAIPEDEDYDLADVLRSTIEKSL